MSDTTVKKVTKRLPKGQRTHIRRMKAAARKEVTIVKVKKPQVVVEKIVLDEIKEQKVVSKPVKKKLASVDSAKVKAHVAKE